MKTINFFAIIIAVILTSSCVTLKAPTVIRDGSVKNYKYIYISPTNSMISSSGIAYQGQYYSESVTVNPSDVIAGILSKQGFIRLSNLKPELSDKTLIVNYGESGRRNIGLFTAIEVTIQFVSAKSNTLICSCTAEGAGSTEADEIRQAINRCLNEVIK